MLCKVTSFKYSCVLVNSAPFSLILIYNFKTYIWTWDPSTCFAVRTIFASSNANCWNKAHPEPSEIMKADHFLIYQNELLDIIYFLFHNRLQNLDEKSYKV